MAKQQSHAHHYVPQWYQRLFLLPGQSEFFCLDLHPDVTIHKGVSHPHKALFRWGPRRCFYEDDLYTLRFGNETSDEMETLFFGDVDMRGHASATEFANFAGISTLSGPDSFRNLPPYMGAQRFRTPRGLDEIRKLATYQAGSQNATLAALAHVFQAYTTMWMEGVWEIVRARLSPTKFIVTDDPVTFYCKVMFPSEWKYPSDASLKQIGTRTIFPLNLDSCLIVTHLQLVRNPRGTPTEIRENARYYDQTVKHLGEIQFGRELEEDEVLRINYILKRRATRYLAAGKEEWLCPERYVSTTEWTTLDDDWFLLPHLWKVPFRSEVVMGGRNWTWAADEYGRHPGHPRFQNRRQHDLDWVTAELGKKEWAKKRLGKSLAQIDAFERGDVDDVMMRKFLVEEGLLPVDAEAAASET